MTRNQLAYYELVEKKRSNLANENISTNTLAETKRHNLAGESFNLAQLAESSRHNKATEGISLSSLAETTRHNLNTESAANTGNRLRKEELDLAQQKEEQRIKESLRDFNETVRYHNLSALTSRAVSTLLTSSGMAPIFKKLGIAAGTTGAALVTNLKAAGAKFVQSATNAKNEFIDEVKGVTSKDFVMAMSKLVQQLPIVLEQQMDLVNPIRKDQDNPDVLK